MPPRLACPQSATAAVSACLPNVIMSPKCPCGATLSKCPRSATTLWCHFVPKVPHPNVIMSLKCPQGAICSVPQMRICTTPKCHQCSQSVPKVPPPPHVLNVPRVPPLQCHPVPSVPKVPPCPQSATTAVLCQLSVPLVPLPSVSPKCQYPQCHHINKVPPRCHHSCVLVVPPPLQCPLSATVSPKHHSHTTILPFIMSQMCPQGTSQCHLAL